jgi:AraC-like DNA-binding protein
MMLGVLMGGLSLWWMVRLGRNRFMLRSTLETERKQAARTEEISRHRMDLLVNISNEFRTPITLIVSQLERLAGDVPAPVRCRLERVRREAARLQDLIEEMIDFRRMEENRFRLKIGQHDLAAFLSGLYETFSDCARERRITFRLNPPEPAPLWFDRRQLEKVFYNILIFLFQSSPEKASVTLSAHRTSGYTKVLITHRGTLSPEAEAGRLLAILDGEDPAAFSSPLEGAMGMTFVKRIILLHGGTLSVRREEGCTMLSLALPSGAAHIRPEDIDESPAPPPSIPGLPLLPPEDMSDPVFSEKTAPGGEKTGDSMVVVEEDDGMCLLLRETFSPLYEVTVFRDAESAAGYIIERRPDIVLSETGLPGMSGIELCARIKSNLHTWRIPVVLITSHPSGQQHIESIRAQADWYVVKPFDLRILFMRCNYLVRHTRLLSAQAPADGPTGMTDMAADEREREFLRKAASVAEENWKDSAFDTKHWYEKLGIGRTRFFHRIKAVTGMTPNDYLLRLKMDKSLGLLRERPDRTIAEIAYQLGFSSPAYFSKCFRKQFGVTPQEYRRK